MAFGKTTNRRVLGAALGAAIAFSATTPAFAAGGGSSSSNASRSPSYTDSYVAIDTMQVSIIQSAQINGMLVISIGLDIEDPHLREHAEHVMPRLRDAYINRLSRHGATRVDPRRVPNVTMLAGILQSTTDEVLGEEGARVLLVNVLVRPGVHRRGALHR